MNELRFEFEFEIGVCWLFIKAKKLNENHAWFLDTVSCFKSPNQKSREALDSTQFTVGTHTLTVQPELKASALELSSVLVSFDINPDHFCGTLGFHIDIMHYNLTSVFKLSLMEFHFIYISVFRWGAVLYSCQKN